MVVVARLPFEISDSNLIQGKQEKCGRSLAPPDKQALKGFHRTNMRKMPTPKCRRCRTKILILHSIHKNKPFARQEESSGAGNLPAQPGRSIVLDAKPVEAAPASARSICHSTCLHRLLLQGVSLYRSTCLHRLLLQRVSLYRSTCLHRLLLQGVSQLQGVYCGRSG